MTAIVAKTFGQELPDFEGRVPYDEYLHGDILRGLQHPRSGEPGEMSFLVISQIMELYFKLIRFELNEAAGHLRGDEVRQALDPLHRAALHLQGLDGTWQSLRWMTSRDFLRFREVLGNASGMQSPMYRLLEFKLGLKAPSLARPFKRVPEIHRDVVQTLEEPSIWDDTIAVLAKRGHDIPAELLERDFATEYQPHPAVEAAWVQIYRDESPDNHLRSLGEALTDVSERFDEWRRHHLQAVRRILGAKSGTGGTGGVGWLERSMARTVFPELWSARTHM